MSRPTDLEKYSQADEWMKETFGQGLRDYVDSERSELLSVCVVEIAKVIRKADVRKLLVQWRAEDVKSAAGIQAILTTTDALTLVLLQIRLRRKTLVTELADTYLEMSATHRKILGMRPHHKKDDEAAYSRVWESIQRLIALIDEFPGRKDKILTESEFGELIASRDPADCRMRRERMFQLANGLLEGTRLCLPKELRDRSDGSVGLDASMVELYGKTGNLSSKTLSGNRQTANPDGGWYGREGDHSAISKADAAQMNKQDPNGKHKGTATKDLSWGIEFEVVRQVANFGQDRPNFPLISVGWSAHIPGAIRGEADRVAESLIQRGHKAGFFITDRAYPNGRAREYAIPLRQRGYKHVFSYKRFEIGVGELDPRGFVQISGSWYLDTVPLVLREADLIIFDARNVWFAINAKHLESKNPNPDENKEYEAAKKVYKDAETLFAKQFSQRDKSRLKAKGRMDENCDRRYLVPIQSPDYLKWKAKPGAHQGVTVEMKSPTDTEFDNNANAGGLKREQHFPWGGPDWRHMSGKRNGVESLNANVKRGQYEGVKDASMRAIRGNTFTYLVTALALVSENLRKMLSFFKELLSQKILTAKNKKIAVVFWQAEYASLNDEQDIEPPG